MKLSAFLSSFRHTAIAILVLLADSAEICLTGVLYPIFVEVRIILTTLAAIDSAEPGAIDFRAEILDQISKTRNRYPLPIRFEA